MGLARACPSPQATARLDLLEPPAAGWCFAQEQGASWEKMAGAAGGRDLPSTPTWAVALVCTVIVLISVAMEHGLHKLGHVRHLPSPACSSIVWHVLIKQRLSLILLCLFTPGFMQWFHTRQKKAMREALEKIKAGGVGRLHQHLYYCPVAPDFQL